MCRIKNAIELSTNRTFRLETINFRLNKSGDCLAINSWASIALSLCCQHKMKNVGSNRELTFVNKLLLYLFIYNISFSFICSYNCLMLKYSIPFSVINLLRGGQCADKDALLYRQCITADVSVQHSLFQLYKNWLAMNCIVIWRVESDSDLLRLMCRIPTYGI